MVGERGAYMERVAVGKITARKIEENCMLACLLK
jgi:hypothetical protein